jgi:hypothetical protein
MRRGVLAAIVLIFAMRGESTAHQLDEYLQATRVSLARNRVLLEIDLTPGAAIASEVITRLDRDGDKRVSPIEAAEYGQLVLSDLILKLDERSIPITLVHVEIASIDALRSGIGAIQMRAVSDLGADVTGRCQIYFRNNHQPSVSVYMVNALVPEDRNVSVMRQTRNPSQQEVHIDYNVGPQWPVQILWLVCGALGLLTLAMARSGGERWV